MGVSMDRDYRGSTLALRRLTMPHPAERRVTYCVAGAGATPDIIGDSRGATGTQANVAADGLGGVRINNLSGTVLGNQGGQNGGTIYRVGRSLHFRGWVLIPVTLTLQRLWVVLAERTLAQMNSDDPASAHLMGFRYSTTPGDTKWQCATKDGTTLGLTDSGVTVAVATGYELEMEAIDSGASPLVVFRINDRMVAQRNANLPAAGTNLRYIIVVETRESGVARAVEFSWFVITSDL